jgi:hypothetical protein
MSTVYLNRQDLDKIKEVLDNFEYVNIFEIRQDRSSGIGSTTDMIFDVRVKDVTGKITVSISGAENW